MNRESAAKLLVLGCALLSIGCASWKGNAGVENVWRSDNAPTWIVGKTTEAQVTDALGPPSQIIGLERETVFYYLREHMQGRGFILLLWNWGEHNTRYDRAIFFFDKHGVLTKYSYSPEALPYEETL